MSRDCIKAMSVSISKNMVSGRNSLYTIVFPTETCYGLGVDATSVKAVKKLYCLKGRDFKKPVHVVVSSRAMAKLYVKWSEAADRLAKAFWPGSLTLVLPVKKSNPALRLLTAGKGFLGVRMPKHPVPLSLVRKLKKPITATSANLSGRPECYSLAEVREQFKRKKLKPDILIDGGRLKKVKPSTVVKISEGGVELLRAGPVSLSAIRKALSS